MSSEEFVEGAAEAFRVAEAALRDGHSLEAVLTPGLILRSATCPGQYDFFGTFLFHDSAGYCFYEVIDDVGGGFVVQCFHKETCGGGTRAPGVMYTVTCPSIVDVAQVLLLDQGQPHGCQCWGRDSPLQSEAPTLAAALEARPHCLVRSMGRRRADVTVGNLLTMAENLASGVRMKTWDATLSYYGVIEADLVAIHAPAQGLGPALLAHDEATWPACLLGAVDRTCPVRTESL